MGKENLPAHMIRRVIYTWVTYFEFRIAYELGGAEQLVRLLWSIR